MLNGYGNIIDEVTYSDKAPWPVEADGDDYFLELIDTKLDNNDPSNWQAAQFVKTAINSDLLKAELQVYPNPASEIIHIDAQSMIKNINVWDLDGRLRMSVVPNKINFTLQITDLDRAIYLLEVQTATGLYTRKLLISK